MSLNFDVMLYYPGPGKLFVMSLNLLSFLKEIP